jgi:bifunctional non-homologous end joining protein LigD
MERKVTLYSTENGSDKVYQIHQRPAPQGAGWLVDRANGARGKALRPGTETPTPVDLASANRIYDDLLKSKLKKGYHEGENGASYTSSEFAGRASSHRQQLPTAITEERAQELLASGDWAIQEKANGERRSIIVSADGQLKGVNKLGLFCEVPQHWQAAFHLAAREGGLVIDGEQIGDHLYAFDVLDVFGNDIRHRPFDYREQQIHRLLAHHPALAEVMKPLRAFRTPAEKQQAAHDIQARGGEGYVLKLMSAPYEPGRSDTVLKFKFTETSTCIVIARNAQRSVNIGLIDAAGQVRSVGNVTIPANFSVPDAGELVEIQFLYFNPGGAFEQPVYLGPRNDVTRDECHFGQVLRLKPGVGMPAELWTSGLAQLAAASAMQAAAQAGASRRRARP